MQYLKRKIEAKSEFAEGLMLYALAILVEILRNELNPSQLTDCIKTILKNNPLKVGQNCALYLLADCIAASTAVYLDDLLSLSKFGVHIF